MQIDSFHSPLAALALAGGSLAVPVMTRAATTNNWTGAAGDGKWETPGNWSPNAPSLVESLDSLGPPGSTAASATIDSTTTAFYPSTLTISNLLLFGRIKPLLAPFTLSLNNAGTATSMFILNTCNISAHTTISIVNSALDARNIFDDGTLMLASGSVIVPSIAIIGNAGAGTWTVSNGTCAVDEEVIMGQQVGSSGTLTMAGGTTSIFDQLDVAFNSNTVGTIWLTGGLLTGPGGDAIIGDGGFGQMVVSNAEWQAGSSGFGGVYLGTQPSGQGTLIVVGGSVSFLSDFVLGSAAGSSGTLWLTSSQLMTTSLTSEAEVGGGGTGQAIISNGNWQSARISIGAFPHSQGTLTLLSGSVGAYYGLGVGDDPVDQVGGTGTLWVAGGDLNGGGDLDIGGFGGSASMTVSNGTWEAENLNLDGTPGQLNIAGGTGTLLEMFIGFGSHQTQSVWMTGGQLVVSGQLVVADSAVGQMTVSNGTWQAGSLTVSSGLNTIGTLAIAGGTGTIADVLLVNDANTGTVWMTGGQLTVGTATVVGDRNIAQMTVSNGTWQTGNLTVGNGGTGTLILAGGTNAVTSTLRIGAEDGGTVWLTGGRLTATNDATVLGGYGTGQLIMSNGNWLASELDIGAGVGSQGTLTMLGGQMTLTNGTGQIAIGLGGLGRLALSGGSILARGLCVGCSNGPDAQLTMLAGSLTVLSNMVVGDCGLSAFAVVEIESGTCFVTNATHNAVLEVRNGVLLLDGGSLVVDRLVATNGCFALFDHTGGTLSVSSVLLDPNQDIDGDGLPNGWELAHGLDPLSSVGDNGPNGDPDGDGYSNLQEYLAGSDPLNPLSTPLQVTAPPFQITSVVRSNNNIILTWNTAGGLTNQVQVTSGGTGGSYAANAFTNLGPQLLIGGSGITTTNYVDVGGATNGPARYYRVRLVP